MLSFIKIGRLSDFSFAIMDVFGEKFVTLHPEISRQSLSCRQKRNGERHHKSLIINEINKYINLKN